MGQAWRRHGISLIKWCIQFWCVGGVCEDKIKTMLKVINCLIQKGIILTAWLRWEVG